MAGAGNPALHAACCPWLRERGGGHDRHRHPQRHPPGAVSLHGQLLSRGLSGGHGLIDNANLEDLAQTATRLNGWEFLLTIAPLRLKGVTGSPVNPIAVF